MKRKTVPIVDLIDRVNEFLFHSPDDQAQARSQMAMFLEKILMDNGQYQGFNYLNPNQMLMSQEGTTYGVRWEDNNPIFTDTDHTRTRYYGGNDVWKRKTP
jgi:hypothetical protein